MGMTRRLTLPGDQHSRLPPQVCKHRQKQSLQQWMLACLHEAHARNLLKADGLSVNVYLTRWAARGKAAQHWKPQEIIRGGGCCSYTSDGEVKTFNRSLNLSKGMTCTNQHWKKRRASKRWNGWKWKWKWRWRRAVELKGIVLEVMYTMWTAFSVLQTQSWPTF